MSNKYIQVTVISIKDGRRFEGSGNEIESAGVTCTVSGLRPAWVRIVIRDGATHHDLHMALRALKAKLNELADLEPGIAASAGYRP